jgi:hypothetical protein
MIAEGTRTAKAAIRIRATGLRGCFVEQLAGFFQKSHLFFG